MSYVLLCIIGWAAITSIPTALVHYEMSNRPKGVIQAFGCGYGDWPPTGAPLWSKGAGPPAPAVKVCLACLEIRRFPTYTYLFFLSIIIVSIGVKLVLILWIYYVVFEESKFVIRIDKRFCPRSSEMNKCFNEVYPPRPAFCLSIRLISKGEIIFPDCTLCQVLTDNCNSLATVVSSDLMLPLEDLALPVKCY